MRAAVLEDFMNENPGLDLEQAADPRRLVNIFNDKIDVIEVFHRRKILSQFGKRKVYFESIAVTITHTTK